MSSSDGDNDTTGSMGIKKFKTQKSEALWLTSFCDLSLILMSFFALMLSMSTFNVKRADTVMDTIKSKVEPKKTSGPPKQNLETIFAQIKNEIKHQKLENAAQVTLDENGLAIEFKSGMMFDSGSADINPKNVQYTNSILAIIAQSPPKYALTIEGHTDDTPIGAHAKYQDNWQLSAQRGVSVLNELKRRSVNQERMKIISYAETRPKVPIINKKGTDLESARAANRRVVIRLD